jgi:hypothetical protein
MAPSVRSAWKTADRPATDRRAERSRLIDVEHASGADLANSWTCGRCCAGLGHEGLMPVGPVENRRMTP